MTIETAKRRIPNITRAIEGTLENIKEAQENGNTRHEEAHTEYLKTLRKELRAAQERLEA